MTQGTLIGERYRLLEPLGSGGEAQVFRAHDSVSEIDVAVRMGLQPATYTPTQALPPFHSGWVRLIDHGIDPTGGAYQVLELLDGRSLDRLVEAAPLNAPTWHDFVTQSLNAVEALHHAGWIHGDLNSDNFIRDGAVVHHWKLLELPFLRFDPPPGRSALFGSIRTLAPEQINGTPATILSDLYALGSLYYYAAAGAWPQGGVNAQDIAIERLRFDPAPLSEKAPELPSEWCDGVMRLLERKPGNRVPTVAAARQLLGVA